MILYPINENKASSCHVPVNVTDVIAGLSSIELLTEAIKLSIQALVFLTVRDKQMVLKKENQRNRNQNQEALVTTLLLVFWSKKELFDE